MRVVCFESDVSQNGKYIYTYKKKINKQTCQLFIRSHVALSFPVLLFKPV